MTENKIIIFLLALFAALTSELWTGACRAGELRDALRLAGGNRSELEIAMSKAKGKDTEYLVTHASHYDLLNLTAEKISENVTYAQKVHAALPYLGGRISDALWHEWVLPHRVLDEEGELWRKDFYERLWPLVRDKKTVREAVDALHTWLMVGTATEKARICFGASENRSKTPSQMLKIGKGACGDLSMMMVYCLRAVGIPARHAWLTWRFGGDDAHYNCEYWDTQLHQWVPLDAGDNKAIQPNLSPAEKTKTGALGSATFYARPGWPTQADCYHTALFEQCIPVTDHHYLTYNVEFVANPGAFAGPTPTTAYVWNFNTWRGISRGLLGAPTAKPVPLQLADARADVNRPMLYTATDGKTLLWALKRPGVSEGKVELQPAQPGVCIRWAAHEHPLK